MVNFDLGYNDTITAGIFRLEIFQNRKNDTMKRTRKMKKVLIF